jgi:hypothetical protein
MADEAIAPSLSATPLVSWGFPEFAKRVRPLRWWIAATAAWLALIIWAIFWQHSFLFLLVLLFGAIIFITQERREPDTSECRITPDGVEVDDRLYPFTQLEQFYIIYQPPSVMNLYLERGGFRPTVAIPLGQQDPQVVREALQPRLKEDKSRQGEPVLDQMARRLGLH